MSSNIIQALKDYRKNPHNVGSLNNWGKEVLNQGAIVEGAAIDNYCLAELGFNAAGERTCKALDASDKKGVLVASVEDYVKEYETISAFYNGVGERARIVYLESGMRFECSNFSLDQDESTNPVKNGQKVHYDHDTKKYVISNHAGGNDAGGYGAASNKFVIVDATPVSIDGQRIIRFEVV